MFRGRSSATTTTTMEIAPVDSSVDSTLSAEQLMVSLDVALRDNRHVIVNTVLAILEKAEGDSTKKFEYVCQMVLIAFKRRNHEKSQAAGTGSGEKDILRTILLALAVVAPDAVKAILPLIPIYGSWKDLNVMAERYMESTPEDSEEIPEMCTVIANIFADQMNKDRSIIDGTSCSSASSSASTSSSSASASADPSRVVLPSSACKYTFSEARHRGSKKNRKVAKAGRAHKIQCKLADVVARRMLSKDAAAGVNLCKRETRPLYRKYVAALRSQLASNGFMIEHNLCNKTAKLIHFSRAPKGALEKYTAAINKDPVAKAKWLKAAKKSQAAVPDINELRDAASQAEAEAMYHPDERMLGRRIVKAIASLQAARVNLVEATQIRLEQLQSTTVAEAAAAAVQASMNEAVGVVVFPAVDTYGCTTQEDVDTLLMSAYIIARSQPNCNHLCFNGQLISLEGLVNDHAMDTENTPAEAVAAAGAVAVAGAKVSAADILKAMEWFTSIDLRERGWHPSPAREENEVCLALQSAGAHIQANVEGAGEVTSAPRDLMLLAIALPSDTSALVAAVDALQQPASASVSVSGPGFRSVLVHKLKADVGETIDFKLRTHSNNIPRIDEMVIDVCILMDFTGSMGSWMSAAKDHLTTIIRSLQTETRAKEVRVAFVGYRDWKDTGRVVQKDFVGTDRAEDVITAIRDQQASGGADEPEDVLIGMEAVNSLDWRGDIRVCLHVADATAHGYTSTCDYIHDNYPSGLCPDQAGKSLADEVRRAADQQHIDMVFCECNPTRTKDLRNLYQGVYAGPGFGILPLAHAGDFKDKILGALSQAVLSLHVDQNVAGLQSFAGNTLSALISTMNTSLRESLLAVSDAVEALQAEAEAEAEEGGLSVKLEPEEESEIMVEAETAVAAAVGPPKSKSKPKPKREARTDYQRLMGELMSQDLAPVRLLLGMPVANTLALSAGKTLIDSGLSVNDLQTMGYPASIVKVFIDAAARSIETV